MEAFKFTKAADVPQAVMAGAMSSTAQQGATVRFIAGGTTLLDLMKLDVERPGNRSWTSTGCRSIRSSRCPTAD